MRSDEVVGVLDVVDVRIQFPDQSGQIGAGIELVSPGAIASFDDVIELRPTRRQHIELAVALLALALDVRECWARTHVPSVG